MPDHLQAIQLQQPRRCGLPSAARWVALAAWAVAGMTHGFAAQATQHWSFQPLRKPPLPTVQDSRWVRNPIDAFVLARLEKEGVRPASEARQAALLRRATLDLTGLAPTPEALRGIETTTASQAFERAVDQLLASERYGERMAWDWLDAARYADSNGYQGDSERTMWPWRDWVVAAFNRNLPFDQFTLWQLAGDLLPDPTPEQRLATGFCRNHMINGEGGRIPEENRVDYVMDMTETMGTVWLGLTLNCSRCHDHKYDPVSQKDYYGLFGLFNQTPVDGSGGDPQTRPTLEAPSPAQARARDSAARSLEIALVKLDAAEQQRWSAAAGKRTKETPGLEGAPAEILEGLNQPTAKRDAGRLRKLADHFRSTQADYAALLDGARAALEERNRILQTIPKVMVMEDRAERRETFLLVKGLYDKPREKVVPGLPGALARGEWQQTTNRLGLARWLISPENPLTARVIVNRYWQQFFGVGLVKTAEDFGLQGERPSHPELLDWLAADFIESGWDVKALCRLIVTSATYRQASKADAASWERDPQNRLLGRGPRFRMPSWMLRDQSLAAADQLCGVVGGAPVKPYQPPGLWEEATFGNKQYKEDAGSALYRRSLYTFWRRIVAPPLFFDNPSRQTCTVKQPRTNTPLHALATLNDTTYVEAARLLAENLLQAPNHTARQRIDQAFRRLLARTATAAELDRLEMALKRYEAQFRHDSEAAQALIRTGASLPAAKTDPAELAAYTLVCSTLLNLDEALTKE